MDYNKLCLLKGINKNFFKNLNCSTAIENNNDNEMFNFFSSLFFLFFIGIIPIFVIYKFWNRKSKKTNKNKETTNKNKKTTNKNKETKNKNKEITTSSESCSEIESITELADTSQIFLKNDDVSKEKILEIVYSVISKDTVLSISNINKLVKNIKKNESMQEAYKKAKKIFNTFNHQTKNLPIYKQIISKLQQLPINHSKYDNIIILFLTISYAKL